MILIVASVYSDVSSFSFLNFDDNIYVTNNPFVNQGLSLNALQWAFTKTHGGHWHPLSWISHQIDVTLFGLKASALHFSNLAHFLTALILIYFLILRLIKNYFLSFVMTLLFALHPFRIESVAWITERKDLLMLVLGLVSTHFYLSFVQTQKNRFQILSVFFYALALLAKPTMIILPLCLILLDLRQNNNLFTIKMIRSKLIYFVLGFLCGLMALWAQNNAGALKNLAEYPLETRLFSSITNLWVYCFKSLIPTSLSIFHPYKIFSLTTGLISLLGFFVISIFLILKRKTFPSLFFGWSWFVISLLPTLGILQVGAQQYAERWTLWPHMGILLAIVIYLSSVKLIPQKIFFYALVIGILFYLPLTQNYLSKWENSETLFRQALKTDPSNFLAHNNLGEALLQKNKIKKAQWHFKQSLKFHPNYSPALNNVGLIMANQNNLNVALDYFQRALKNDPTNANSQYNLALAHYQIGEKIRATREWINLLNQNPYYENATHSLEFSLKNNPTEMCPILKNEFNSDVNIFQKLHKICLNQ